MALYIDNDKRKRIVTFWIPVCLGLLHGWATAIVVAAIIRDRDHIDGNLFRYMFSSCVTGIGCLILLLISDKALEFVIERITGAPSQKVEKETTEKITTTPIPPQGAQDGN